METGIRKQPVTPELWNSCGGRYRYVTSENLEKLMILEDSIIYSAK